MLEPITWYEEGEVRQIDRLVQFSDRLPGVFRQRMEQLEAVHRWLAGYFQAVAILLQIPGAAEYRCIDDQRADFWDHTWTRDGDVTRSLLAAALGRLDAASLMDQVPGGSDYRTRRLPHEVHLRLAALDRNELLNVVAACLDRLLVVPELEDEAELYGIDAPPPRWWWPFDRSRGRRNREHDWTPGSGRRLEDDRSRAGDQQREEPMP